MNSNSKTLKLLTILLNTCNGTRRPLSAIASDFRENPVLQREDSILGSSIAEIVRQIVAVNSVEQCKQVHTCILKLGIGHCMSLGNALVTSYMKYHASEHAHQVFDRMPERDTVSWKALISGLGQCSHFGQAFAMYLRMGQLGLMPDHFTFVSIFRICASLQNLGLGNQIHCQVIKHGFENFPPVLNSLLSLHYRCGCVENIESVFRNLPRRDVVAYNMVFAKYVRHGFHAKVFQLLSEMLETHVFPDAFTIVSVIKACCGVLAMQQAMEVHASALKAGFEKDLFVVSALIDVYGKCGHVSKARYILDRTHNPNLVCYNAMISAYVQNEYRDDALLLFSRMYQKGLIPDEFSFSTVLNVCSIEQGKQIHALALTTGSEQEVPLGNALITVYAHCGNLEYGCRVFNKMKNRDLITWNAMIAGLADNANSETALTVFSEMVRPGIRPDEFSLATVLSVCNIQQVEQVHTLVTKLGYESDLFVSTSLVDKKAEYGLMKDAIQVFSLLRFPTISLCNIIMEGYLRNEQLEECLSFFQEAKNLGLQPDSFTLCCLLRASPDSVLHGRQIHSFAIKHGFVELDIYLANILLGFYLKCDCLDSAFNLFEALRFKDDVSYATMISGYANNGNFQIACNLFHRMQVIGMYPDEYVLATILTACTVVESLKSGEQIHGHLIKNGYDTDIFVGSALLDLYAKCGDIEDAAKLFAMMHVKNVVSWNTMVVGRTRHGHANMALDLFNQMQNSGVKPNGVTFLAVLSACSHAGLVDLGLQYYACMQSDFNVQPKPEHHACVIDLLSRGGRLNEAKELAINAPNEPNSMVRNSLSGGACSAHENLILTKPTTKRQVKFEP